MDKCEAKSFDLLLLAVPIEKKASVNYDEFCELYYGALPGSMQVIEENVLYYEYFFFKADSINSLLKQEESFKVILVKKQVNPGNIDQMGLLDY